ncbi:MAG: hypothetical protein E7172_02580 [Firmicutes bacterium]|nr:hypothetical protein [Bacillota bacterium]
MKELVKFKYENNEYVIIGENNKIYYRQVNSKKYEKIKNIKEIKLFNEIIKQIFPTNIINLGIIPFNNKKYQHFIDNNKLHIFYEINKDKCLIPKIEELKLLNLLFNKVKDKIYNNENNQVKESDFYKRIVKIGKKFITVLISCSLFFNITNVEANLNEEIFVIDESIEVVDDFEIINDSEINISFEEESLESLSTEKIIDLIKNNDNLSNEEKMFFSSNEAFFNKIAPYLVVNHFEDFDVVYEEKNDENLYGFYEPWFNKITINNADDFSNANLATVAHEFLHLATCFELASPDGRLIIEAMTSNFVREYYGMDDQAYIDAKPYFYVLCEIINEEALLNFYGSGNIELIINELEKIIPNKEMAYKTIVDFDLINYTEIDEELKEFAKNELNNNLKIYYETKYNKEIKNDLRIYSVLDSINALNEIKNMLKIEEEIEIKIDNKYYFNKDLNYKDVLTIIKKEFMEKEYIVKIEEALNLGLIEQTIDNEYIIVNDNCEFLEYGKVKYLNKESKLSFYTVENDCLSNSLNK